MNWLLIGCSWHTYCRLYRLFKYVFIRPFAWWRHTTTMTRILQGFTFLCKLGLLSFKPHWGFQIYIWKEKRKTKRILVVVIKWRHRANGLLEQRTEKHSSAWSWLFCYFVLTMGMREYYNVWRGLVWRAFFHSSFLLITPGMSNAV